MSSSLVVSPSVPSLSISSPKSSRPSSIDLGVGPASVALSITNVNGYPRSSILLNSRKRAYKGLVYAGNTTLHAPVVTHIPAAVPSRKHKERVRVEREREREYIKPKSKNEEKVWGIPKKALLLGLGDINSQSTERKRLRASGNKRSVKTDDSDDSRPSTSSNRISIDSADKQQQQQPQQEEAMDPEELAALNAIINTRRSMAAAQALVSGQITATPKSVRGSSFGSATQPRPVLDGQRRASQDSVPGMSTFTQSSSTSLDSSSNNNNLITPQDEKVSSVKSPGSEQARIRFAPLPQPTIAPFVGEPVTIPGSDGELNDSDLDDSDYDSDDQDAKSMKGKWYLMGMPPAVFTSQYYTGKSSRRSKLNRNGSVSSFGAGDLTDDNEDGTSLHRKSTSSLTEAFSADAFRRFSSDADDDDRGRASTSSLRSKRSKSQPRRRSRSRNGISSGDEDERARRRQMIRLARPGGTGMVTLPDGTKIRARRVNDAVATEEPEFNEWGFAGLAREASRRNLSNPASLATTPNDGVGDQKSLSTFMAAEEEEDDGSGMAWVRRRRREREERARKELEQAATAASAATTALDSSPGSSPASEEATQASAVALPDKPVSPPPPSTLPGSPRTAQPSDYEPTRTESLFLTSPTRANMFYADPESMPATPTVDHPSAINFPTMQSEAPTSDSPMSGSQLLSRAHASNAGDSTPRHTAHGLSVGQAEIIRKRHEDEVAALGAEVLAQTRRNTQRRQASTSVMPFTPATAAAGDASSADKGANKPALQSTAPSGTSTPLGTASTSRDSAFEKNALTRAVGSMMRKATADSDRTVRSGNEDGPLTGSSSNNTKKKVEPTLPLVTEPETGGPQQSMPVRSPVQRSDSPESVRSRKSVSDVVTPAKSVSSLHGTSAPSTHSPLSKRMMTNASISTPAPSPWLPRRPDARGLAVVPLPQLGIRPERPHEGRVWQYDVDDESDIEAAASDKEDEGSDLDAEELEEEELKTAMQKKRATTLAAGQEVVHASLESKAKATSRAGKVSSSSYDVEPLRSSKLYSAKRRSSVAGSRQNGPAVPSGPKRAPPRLVRTVTSTSSRQNDAEDDSDDDIDEKDLWPAASATSKTGTPRPRHILVNLPGGPGIWDTKTGGGKNAVAAINSVAAARARAIKKRADKRISYDLPAGWRDEMMDYGWGRSAV